MGPPPAERVHANEEEHTAFKEKVRRCLLLEDVTPLVTVAMIQTALGQFGTVAAVTILPNPLEPKTAPKRVVVEMSSAKQAAHAVEEIQERPFMIKGVPRPVKAMLAVGTLFPDRPRQCAGLKRSGEWVKPGDADWEFASKQKRLAKKHAAEAAYLTQELRKEEEKLAQEQEETVKENIKKLDEIYKSFKDNTIQRLSRYYAFKCEIGERP